MTHRPTRLPRWTWAGALLVLLALLWTSANLDAVPAAPLGGAVELPALSLFAFDAVAASASAAPARPAIELPEPPATPACSAGARVDGLARLAVGSLDPVVYAIALEACKGSLAADAAACKLLSRTQWARLDADSALPWLELAAEASRQQAFDAEAEAMQHAAMARRIDAHAGALPELVERALSQAHTYCGADAVADRERRPICGAMAEMLVSRSSSAADLGVGLAIGRNLGWDVERLEALQHEQNALGEGGGLQTIGVGATSFTSAAR